MNFALNRACRIVPGYQAGVCLQERSLSEVNGITNFNNSENVREAHRAIQCSLQYLSQPKYLKSLDVLKGFFHGSTIKKFKLTSLFMRVSSY